VSTRQKLDNATFALPVNNTSSPEHVHFAERGVARDRDTRAFFPLGETWKTGLFDQSGFAANLTVLAVDEQQFGQEAFVGVACCRAAAAAWSPDRSRIVGSRRIRQACSIAASAASSVIWSRLRLVVRVMTPSPSSKQC
jgi:hypothetical protein